MTTRSTTSISMAASLILSVMIAGSAQAGPLATGASQVVHKPVSDVFSSETQAHKELNAAVPGGNAPTKWFESFDSLIESHNPTDADRFILSRRFDQDPKR